MDENVKHMNIHFLEENIRENHHDLRLGKEFLEITPKG